MVVILYRALVALLPHRVREAWGAEIVGLFADEWRASRRRGPRAALRVAALGIIDLLVRLPREHWRAAGALSTEESMQSFWYDLRTTCRTLLRQRGSAAMILVTLTLAVACNSAVFTLLDGIFFRPFPFRDPGRLVYLNEQAPKWNLDFTGINYPDLVAWRHGTHRFESISAFGSTDLNVALPGSAERVRGAQVSWDMARTLGITPVLGRMFRPDEDRPDGPNVAMVSYHFWQSRLLGAKDIIGKPLRMNDAPYTIVGVLPAGVEFPGDAEFWTPLDADTAASGQTYEYDGVARMKPGVTLAAARADLLAAHEVVWRASDSAHVVSPRIMSLRERFDSEYANIGRILGLSAIVVLLIACANVGAAMLVRATMRRRELAVRVALGASGRRVARQILTESLVFAVIAGAAGAILGWWGIRALALGSSNLLPPGIRLGFDWRLAAFCAGTMGLVTLLFGAVPAFEARRQGLLGIAALGERTGSTSIRQRRILDGLVVAEIALATVLLVGGGLLFRAFRQLETEDPGFRVSGAMQFSLSLPQATYPDAASQRRLFERTVDGLAALPGVTSAGAVSCPPMGCHWGMFYTAEGSTRTPGSDDPVVLTRIASPGYFRTMGIRFVAGRGWTSGEEQPLGGRFPVVVNQEFVESQWHGATNVIGRRIATRHKDSPWMTVVGVVHDARHYGLDQPMRPGIYMPMSWIEKDRTAGAMTFVAHTNGDPRALYSEVRALGRRIDPDLPIIQLETMRNALDASLLQRRSSMLVLSAFAAIALALAVGGIYAVLSFIVGRRRREIGIRMALGALARQIVGMVIRRAVELIAIGLAIGLPLAFAAGRILRSLLSGISPIDGMIYAGAILLLVVTGVAAAIGPALRAATVDPRSALSDP